jgi:hypothetical protein
MISEIKIVLLFGMEVKAVRGNLVDLAADEIVIYTSSNWVSTLHIKMEKMYLYIYTKYL